MNQSLQSDNSEEVNSEEVNSEEIVSKPEKNKLIFRFVSLAVAAAVIASAFFSELLTIKDSGNGLVINEVMTKNTTFMTDSNGKTCDWVELFNSGSSDVNLGNWYITDNDNKLNKFEFPSVNIRPGEYRVVFCDGENYYDRKHDEIHTGFSLSSAGETLLLVSKTGISHKVVIGKSKINISYGRLASGLHTAAWRMSRLPSLT